MNLTNLKEVLEAREVRAEKQRRLLSSGGVLVSFSLNIPGPVKNASLYQLVFEEGLKLLQELPELKGVTAESGQSAAGPWAVFLIGRDDGRDNDGRDSDGLDDDGRNRQAEEIKKVRKKAFALKQRAMDLEENTELGRLFDIDILYKGSEGLPEKVSRTELGGRTRPCLVCGDKAFICVRAGRHRVPEVLMKVTDRILGSEAVRERIFSTAEMTAAEQIALEALRAIMYEVITTPKPGLVDAENNGAHKDMDITVFFDSALAITPYFRNCARTGMNCAAEPAETLLPRLRPLGLEAEEKMYRATAGVNTHKGAIFTLGIFCAAAGILYAKAECTSARPETEIPLLAGKIASVMENGTRGIREEAVNGYPSLREAMKTVPGSFSENGTVTNGYGVRLLLELMSRVDDSNAVRRGGETAALGIRKKAAGILGETGMADMELLLKKTAALDGELIKENLSPGGSADLLAAGYFLRFTAPLLKTKKSSKIS